MKIGILTPSIYMYEKKYPDRIFAPGELARALVTGLVQKGHAVEWFSAPEEPRGSTQVSGNLELLEKELQMRLMQDVSPDISSRMSLFARKMYYEMDLLQKAYTRAQAGHIDVLHQFHSFGYLAHFYQELTNVPTVYTLHDPVPTPDMLEHWLFGRFPTHKFVSISDSQRSTFGDHFIDTVYNGIDIEKYSYDAIGGDGFITVGRMVPEKGIDIAISVAQDMKVSLSIASWINESVTQSEYYKTNIAPLVDGSRIRIMDFLAGEEKVKFFQKAKALLFPLRWNEPFGMVMIEAMATGTPVIAYNHGSVPEVVVDGVTGFIIDEEDSVSTAPRIIRQKGTAGLIEAMHRIGEIDRAACRKHVEEYFTIQKMVEGYEKVYQQITKVV